MNDSIEFLEMDDFTTKITKILHAGKTIESAVKTGEKVLLILDIDDTLVNEISEEKTEQIALPGTLKFFRALKTLGIDENVVFVTARDEKLKVETTILLESLGMENPEIIFTSEKALPIVDLCKTRDITHLIFIDDMRWNLESVFILLQCEGLLTMEEAKIKLNLFWMLCD